MRPGARTRRSKPSLRARIRTFWVVGVVLAALLGAAIWALASFPAFRLHELAVTGIAHVSRDDVIAHAAIDPSENVWLLDTGSIERRVEAIPYVLSARVHRRPPGSVWIEVTERRPIGCVRDAAGDERLVDDDLRVLDALCTPDTAVFYDVASTIASPPGAFIHDGELRSLHADAAALTADGDRYRSFAHDAFGQLEATLTSGITIRFGDDDDLERKQRLIGPILAELGPRASDVRTVDVRAPAAPVVEYRR